MYIKWTSVWPSLNTIVEFIIICLSIVALIKLKEDIKNAYNSSSKVCIDFMRNKLRKRTLLRLALLLSRQGWMLGQVMGKAKLGFPSLHSDQSAPKRTTEIVEKSGHVSHLMTNLSIP